MNREGTIITEVLNTITAKNEISLLQILKKEACETTCKPFDEIKEVNTFNEFRKIVFHNFSKLSLKRGCVIKE